MRGGLSNYFTGVEIKALIHLCALGLFGVLVGLVTGPLPESAQLNNEQQNVISAVQKDIPLQIDIRTATLQELVLLPGIGEKRAQDIIAYRDQHGFSSPRDLMNIKGIGPKTLEKMLPSLLPFGAQADSLLLLDFASGIADPVQLSSFLSRESDQKPVAQKKPNTPSVSKSELTNIVNLNTASAEELCTLPGIGEVKAQAIIDFRTQNGAFQNIEDITKVKGIGAKTLEKLRHRLSV